MGRPLVEGTALVWGYGSAFGAVQGMQSAVLGSAFAYYFGRAHHGAVHGFAKTILIGGTALGPPLLALGPDLLGSFAPVLRLLAPVSLLLAGVAFAAASFRWDEEVLRSDRHSPSGIPLLAGEEVVFEFANSISIYPESTPTSRQAGQSATVAPGRSHLRESTKGLSPLRRPC